MSEFYPIAGEFARINKTFVIPEEEFIEREEEFPVSTLLWGLGILFFVSVMAAELKRR